MNDWGALYARRMAGMVPSDIRERMKLLDQAEIIHLGGGLPDPEIFPYEPLAEASARLWADRTRARAALQYAPSEGYLPLRQWIAGYMTRQGTACEADNIIITNGSQQGLDFLAKLLLSPGDKAMVEIPSFIGALRAFDAYEPEYLGLPEDSGDWNAGELAGAKFCYVGPDFRNPTGTCMSRKDRTGLLDLADSTGMAIIEDGCYEQLRYEGDDIPSIASLAVERYGSIERSPVLNTGTFSKTIAPSLRVGWIAGPREVIRRLVLIKQASDLATSALNQMLLLDVVQEHLDASIDIARNVYRERCRSMLDAMAQFMPQGVSWTKPQGGLYVWAEMPAAMDGGALAARALLERSVSIISGSAFYPAKASNVAPKANTFRLSFSMIPSSSAREGIERLGGLIREG